MAIKAEQLSLDTEYYITLSHKLGNTTLRTLSVFPVRILEFSADRRSVKVNWNSFNVETWDTREACKRLLKSPPTIIRGIWGAKYKATRADLAAYHATGEPVCYNGATLEPIPRKPPAEVKP